MQAHKQDKQKVAEASANSSLHARINETSPTQVGKQPRKTRKITTPTRAIISLVLLACIAYLIDLKGAWTIVSEARIELVFLAIVIALIGRLFAAFRWYLLVRNRNPAAKYRRIVRLVFVSSFLGVFLPPLQAHDTSALLLRHNALAKTQKILKQEARALKLATCR